MFQDIRNQFCEPLAWHKTIAAASAPASLVLDVITADVRITEWLLKFIPKSIVESECSLDRNRLSLSGELPFLGSKVLQRIPLRPATWAELRRDYRVGLRFESLFKLGKVTISILKVAWAWGAIT